MSDWNLTSIGIILMGCSISAAGIIMAVMLVGIPVSNAPYYLFTTIVLIVMSAAVIILTKQKQEQQESTGP
jgi:hypothetical protein